MSEEEKDKLARRNKECPPTTFRYNSRSLQARMRRAAKKDNRPLGFALNQACEDYCKKMGV